MCHITDVFYLGNPNNEKSFPLLPTLLHTRKLQICIHTTVKILKIVKIKVIFNYYDLKIKKLKMREN